MRFQKCRGWIIVLSLINWLGLWFLPFWPVALAVPRSRERTLDVNEAQATDPIKQNIVKKKLAESAFIQNPISNIQPPKSFASFNAAPKYQYQSRQDYPAFAEIGGLVELGKTGETALLHDLFIPLISKPNGSLYFLNPRILDRLGHSFEGNLHLGYRRSIDDRAMLGIFAAWDRRRLDAGCFNQLTIGLEAGYLDWWFGGNIYQPVGKRRRQVAVSYQIDDYALIEKRKMQVARAGVDMQIGRALNARWSGYFGGYYFDGNIKGASLSLEYERPTHLAGLPSRLTWVIGGRYDRYRGASLTLGIKLRADLRARDTGEMVQTAAYRNLAMRRMGSVVRRDPDIIVTQDLQESSTILKWPKEEEFKVEAEEELPVEPLFSAAPLEQQDLPLPDKQGYMKRDSDWYREHFKELQQEDFANWEESERQQYRKWLMEQLCLDDTLSDDMVRKSWREFVFKYHPDSRPARQRRQAEELFMQRQPYYEELFRLVNWSKKQRQCGIDATRADTAKTGEEMGSREFSDNSNEAIAAAQKGDGYRSAGRNWSMLPNKLPIEVKEQKNQIEKYGNRTILDRPKNIDVNSSLKMSAAKTQPAKSAPSSPAWPLPLVADNIYRRRSGTTILWQQEAGAFSRFNLKQRRRVPAFFAGEEIRANYQKMVEQVPSIVVRTDGAKEFETTPQDDSASIQPAKRWRSLKLMFPEWPKQAVHLAINNTAQYLDPVLYGIATHDLAPDQLFLLADTFFDEALAPEQRILLGSDTQRMQLMKLLIRHHYRVPIEEMGRIVDLFTSCTDQETKVAISPSFFNCKQYQLLELLDLWFSERQFVESHYQFAEFFKYQHAWTDAILSNWLRFSPEISAYARRVIAKASLTNRQLEYLSLAERMKTVLQLEDPAAAVRLIKNLDEKVLARCYDLVRDFYRRIVDLRNIKWLEARCDFTGQDASARYKPGFRIMEGLNSLLPAKWNLPYSYYNLLNKLGLNDLDLKCVQEILLPKSLWQHWRQQIGYATRNNRMASRLAYLVEKLAISSFERLGQLADLLIFLELDKEERKRADEAAGQLRGQGLLEQFWTRLLDIRLRTYIAKAGNNWPPQVARLLTSKLDALQKQDGGFSAQHLLRLFGRNDATLSYEGGMRLLAILDMLLQYAELLGPAAVNARGKSLLAILSGFDLKEVIEELEEIICVKSLGVSKNLEQLVAEMVLNNPEYPQLKEQLAQFVQDYEQSLRLRENWLTAHYQPIWGICSGESSGQKLDPGVLVIDMDAEKMHMRLASHAGIIDLSFIGEQKIAAVYRKWQQEGLREVQPPEIDLAQWQILQQSYNSRSINDLYPLVYEWGLLPSLHGVCKPLQNWTQDLFWSADEVAYLLSQEAKIREKLNHLARKGSDFVKWGDSWRSSEQRSMIDGGEMLAVVAQALHNIKGFYPRPCQLLAAYITRYYPQGALLEVATGEGKTSIIAMFAAMQMLNGHLVDISTSSSELAERDAKEFMDFYQQFAWLAGDNTQQQYTNDTKDAYLADLVYGDINSFIGDELDHRAYGTTKGGRCLADLHVVDEVDNLLIDNVNMMVMLSSAIPGFEQLSSFYTILYGLFKDAAALIEESKEGERSTLGCYLKSKEQLEKLGLLNQGESDERSENADTPAPPFLDPHASAQMLGSYFNQTLVNGSRFLADNCPDFLQLFVANLINDSLLKIGRRKNETLALLPNEIQSFMRSERWHLGRSLLLSFIYRQDVHYIIREYGRTGSGGAFKQVLPVDGATGVTLPMLQWSNGLHAFIGLREQLAPRADSVPTIWQSFVDFFHDYPALYGFSGTLGSTVHHKIMQETYGSAILRVPPFMASGRIDYPSIFALDDQSWLRKIVQEVHQYLLGAGRAVLVVFDTIEEAQRLRQELVSPALHNFPPLDAERITMYIYGGEQAKALERAMRAGELIISTNLAGRGADIKLDSGALAAGGLHVIKTSLSESLRVEQQAFGRAGRQGNPGSAQLLLNLAKVVSSCKLDDQIDWQIDGTTYDQNYWQCLKLERDRREEKVVYDKISRVVKRQELQSLIFNQFLLFRSKLLYRGNFSMQLDAAPPMANKNIERAVHCWLAQDGHLFMGAHVGKDKGWQQFVLDDYLQVLMPEVADSLRREFKNPYPRLERLSHKMQSALWFIVEHKWEAQHPRYQTAYQKVKQEFEKECKQRAPYWFLHPTYLYENHQVDEYLLWLLLNPYHEMLDVSLSELSLADTQWRMKLAGLHRIYEKWRDDAVAAWDEELISAQLIEDWGIWFHGRHYLWEDRVDSDMSNLAEQLNSEFSAFKEDECRRLAEGNFYRNAGLLLKSVRERSPLSSGRKEVDSFERCIKLCEEAIAIGESYNSYWLAWYLKGTFQLVQAGFGVEKEEQKSRAIPGLQLYLQAMQRTANYLREQLIPRIMGNLAWVVAHGMNTTSDYVMHEMGRAEVYRCIAEVVEQGARKVQSALQNKKEMAWVSGFVTPSELLGKMDVTALYRQLFNETYTNQSAPLPTFNSSELLITELDGYGFMLFNIDVHKLKGRNIWHYIGAGILSLGLSMVGAVINVMSGGVFYGILGYNLMANGIFDMIKTALAWSNNLPLQFTDFAKGCLIDTVISTALSGALTFLDAIKLANVHGKLLGLARAHGGSARTALLLTGGHIGAGIVLHQIFYRIISDEMFLDDIYEEAARKVQGIIDRNHDALSRLFLTDESNGNSRLEETIHERFSRSIADYRMGMDRRLSEALALASKLSVGSSFDSLTTHAISLSKAAMSSRENRKILGNLEKCLEAGVQEASKQSLDHQTLFKRYITRELNQGSDIVLQGGAPLSDFYALDCNKFYGTVNQTVAINLTDSCQQYHALADNHPKIAQFKQTWQYELGAWRNAARKQAMHDGADLALNAYASLRLKFQEMQEAQRKAGFGSRSYYKLENAKNELFGKTDDSDSAAEFFKKFKERGRQESARIDFSSIEREVLKLKRKTPHIAQEGETLKDIAAQYGLGIEQLTEFNPGIGEETALPAHSRIALPLTARKIRVPHEHAPEKMVAADAVKISPEKRYEDSLDFALQEGEKKEWGSLDLSDASGKLEALKNEGLGDNFGAVRVAGRAKEGFKGDFVSEEKVSLEKMLKQIQGVNLDKIKADADFAQTERECWSILSEKSRKLLALVHEKIDAASVIIAFGGDKDVGKLDTVLMEGLGYGKGLLSSNQIGWSERVRREVDAYLGNLYNWFKWRRGRYPDPKVVIDDLYKLIEASKTRVNSRKELIDLIGEDNHCVVGVRPLKALQPLFSADSDSRFKHVQLFYLKDGQLFDVGFVWVPPSFGLQQIGGKDKWLDIGADIDADLAEYRFSRPFKARDINILSEDSEFIRFWRSSSYNLATNNCQHFVRDAINCMEGNSKCSVYHGRQ